MASITRVGEMKSVVRMISLVVLLTCVRYGASLTCYTCTGARTNEECNAQNDPHQPCNTLDDVDSNRFDTCMTTVSYSAEGDMIIRKECAVGPCSLGTNQNAALGLGCDQSGCQSCCNEDLCNESTAPKSTPMFASLTGYAALMCQLAVAIVAVLLQR